MNFKITALFAFVLLASFSFGYPQEAEDDCKEYEGTCQHKCVGEFIAIEIETDDCTKDDGKICCITDDGDLDPPSTVTVHPETTQQTTEQNAL